MMSDTYQRIQAQSDKEWKFGRAILIRQMNKRSATPSPINMLTKFFIVLKVAYRNRCKPIFWTTSTHVNFLVRICTQKAQQDLRFEENIDAFSMSGQHGRASPILKMGTDENGKCTAFIKSHLKCIKLMSIKHKDRKQHKQNCVGKRKTNWEIVFFFFIGNQTRIFKI